VGDGAFTIDVSYDDSKVVRTEPDTGYGPEPVYMVTRVEVNNTSGRQWYVLARNAVVASFEILVPDKQLIVKSLNKPQQFETWNLGISAVCNLG
jgi:hypothetical protein